MSPRNSPFCTFNDSLHKVLTLKEGRGYKDGVGCSKCSPDIYPAFAMERENNFETYPELASLMFNNLKKLSLRTILHFMCLIERVHRTIKRKYCLRIGTIVPMQIHSWK